MTQPQLELMEIVFLSRKFFTLRELMLESKLDQSIKIEMFQFDFFSPDADTEDLF